ncbi:FAD synthetase family protein [Peribacillus cavernae]|uniref:Riboflavin biosynthesis protein n=1 Tax=Peribacillus cavernae TaxID=1674310 RepID=A0A3S0UF71_9BACI|nr:FAD synthetase family protein [Peribacillus cavernae]MDQ0217388.1 riboflavin kinase/FMN adenylyltransferase [Peribacillus cavernae]RUQ30163.1 FAD synthetase family protein [Peribacillus cavernae]
MKVCYLSYPLDLSEYHIPSVVSLGYFDGVHLAHQRVIQTGIQIAKSKKVASAVMTFHPHPREVLGKGGYSRYLTPLEDKLDIFKNIGVDIAYIVQFSPALSKLQPDDFIEHFIIPLNIKHVVAGFDYKFGSKGAGTPEYLEQRSEGRYEVDIIDPILRYDAKVGSTAIRNYLKQGNISFVNELLGRPYYIEATFAEGLKQNRKTESLKSKISIQKPYLLPGKGMFRVTAFIEGEFYKGLLIFEPRKSLIEETENPVLYLPAFFNQLAVKGASITIEILSSIKEQESHLYDNHLSQVATLQRINS